MNWDFFRPRERFLVLEITPAGTNGLFLSVDDDRNIVFEKLVENAPLAKFLKSPARRRVIAVADSALATTIPVPLALVRERANIKNRITVAELENLIAQAMAKIFNGCRSEAAKRLGVSDLDAVLVGARAEHFKVDRRAFVNPVGVAGKHVELLLEFIFATRPIFENLKPFFNAPEGFFFAEAAQTHLQALSRVRKFPLNLIATDGADGVAGGRATGGGASLSVLQKPKGDYAVLYRERLNWSFGEIIKTIMDALAVTEAAAHKLYCRYHRGALSEDANRAFKKIVEPALAAFFNELEKGKVQGTAYLDMPHALPLRLPHRHGKVTLEEHPLTEVAVELGFTLPGPEAKLRLAGEGRAIPRLLLYFIEAYFDKSNSEINQKLRRRLHWLAG